MDRRKTLVATFGLACALSAAALLGAAPPPSGGNATPPKTDKPAAKDGDKAKDKKAAAPAAGATVGQKAPDFQFTDLTGKNHSLAEFSGKTVVLQWMNPGCPVCKKKMESGEVAKMMSAAKTADPNVVFIFANSTRSDMGGSVDSSAKYLKDNKVDAIAFWEGNGTVGRLYGAKTTPHLFVIDPKGVLAYQGAIDDSESDKKGVNFVVEAVKAIKAGKTPSPASTKPFGCSVKYPQAAN